MITSIPSRGRDATAVPTIERIRMLGHLEDGRVQIEDLPRVLDLATAIGDPAAVLTFERDDGTFGLVGPPGAEPGLEEYKRAWSHRDIRALRAKERGYLISGHVITDRDLLEPGERQTDPFYTEYLSRFKQGYFAGAGVSPDRNLMVALSVHRRIERTEYSDAEKQAIGVIARHVERSLRLSIRLMDAELVNRALGEALARMGLGVFALDSLGRDLGQITTVTRGIEGGGQEINHPVQQEKIHYPKVVSAKSDLSVLW